MCAWPEETIRGWLKAYRKGGLDALRPKPRADNGQSRALPRELSDHLLAIKEEKPELSVQLVIREALATGKVPEGLPLAPSTVHRLLSRAGLMAKQPGEPASKYHRRFAFEKAGDLWMSDVMHGPAVTVAFAFSENTAAKVGALVPDGPDAAPAAAPARRSRKPRCAQPAPVDLGRGRVPPLSAPRPRRRDTARPGAVADEVRHLGADIDDLLLHEAKRKVAKDSHREPRRRRLRGRCRARRR